MMVHSYGVHGRGPGLVKDGSGGQGLEQEAFIHGPGFGKGGAASGHWFFGFLSIIIIIIISEFFCAVRIAEAIAAVDQGLGPPPPLGEPRGGAFLWMRQ